MATPPLPPGFVLESEAPTTGLPELPPGFELEGPPIQDMPTMSVRPAEFSELSGVTREERQRQIAQMDAEQAARQASFDRTQQFGRAAGLTGRAMLKGLAAVPDIIVEPLTGLVNRLGEKGPNLSSLITGEQERYFPKQMSISQGIDYLIDRVGGVTPQTSGERVYSDVVGGATGAVVPVGVGRQLMQSGSQVVRGVGQTLAAQPGLQMASAATGSGAASATREGGGGTGAQIVAGLAGGLAPTGVTSGLPALARGGLRGGEAGRQRMTENIAAFQQAGTAPSLGQATQSRFMQGAENLLAGGPTSGGVMNRFAERQAEQIGEGLQDTAERLSRNASAERAGRAVESGVEQFSRNASAMKRALYWQADQYIPSNTTVPLSNTWQTVVKLTTPTQGATATTGALVNPRVAQLRDALQQDLAAGGGVLPYEALKRIRTDIGEQLSDFSLSPDTPTRELKQLYASLSRDMEAAAKAQGPEAARAAKRANNYTRAVADRLERVERVVDKNGGPEKVFQAAMSGTKDGGTTLRAVMQSLPEDGQKAVTAAVIKRMGLARAGQQTADGDAFSASTFLTNWNNLSKEAKRTLFDRYGPSFSADMGRIAKVASNLREGSQVFANPSGTANRAAAYTYGASLAASLLDPSFTTTGALVGGGIGANAWARALTNPRFVSWLSKQTEAPVGALPAQMVVLRGIAERQNEPELAEIADLIEQTYQQKQQETQGQ